MPANIIKVSDQAVMAALNHLVGAVENPKPYLQTVGEDIVTRIKERFSSASGPDGQPWAANSPVTLARYIQSKGRSGKKNSQLLAASKKPLHGETGMLEKQFHVSADSNSVTVGNSMEYATTQQFGALQGAFGRDKRNHPIPWGNIPARPFMPITATGELYPQDRDLILEGLARYIQGSVENN